MILDIEPILLYKVGYTDNINNAENVSCGDWPNFEITLEMLSWIQPGLTVVIDQTNPDLLVRSEKIDISTGLISAS